ncbi:MAG: hypothetical protein ACRD3I_12225, partial [Terriglobales bacterium]
LPGGTEGIQRWRARRRGRFPAKKGEVTLRIGVIGDFNSEFHSHPATNRAIERAATKLGVDVRVEWVPTPSVVGPDIDETLSPYDGLWLAPGSPYASMQGALKGACFARTRGWPFTGT